MIEMRKRFDEVMMQRDSKCCETCPIYFECQEMPDRYDEHPIYDCDDLLFGYLVKGKDFKEILEEQNYDTRRKREDSNIYYSRTYRSFI